jgi:hypothetical protein
MTSFQGALWRGDELVGPITGRAKFDPGPPASFRGYLTATGVKVGETLRLDTDGGLSINILIGRAGHGSFAGTSYDFASQGAPIAGDPSRP